MLNDLIAKNIPMGVILTQDGRICHMNPWACRFIDYDANEVDNKSFLDFIHPGDRERMINRYQEIITGEVSPKNERYRVNGKNGELFWIRFRSTLIEYKGKPALLSFLIDETKGKEYEQSLETSEQRYRDLVNNIAEGIVVVQDGRICFINNTLRKKLALEVEDISGKLFLEFVHPEDHEKIIDRYQRRLKGEILPESYEVRLVKPDGEVLACELRASKILWENAPATQTAILDISARKKAEKEKKKWEKRLVRMEKMEALGLLAGSVAHDLNNVLSGIASYPEVLLMDLPDIHPLRQPLEMIHDSGRKASAIVNDLLTLARRGVSSGEVLNLNYLIRDYLGSPEYRKLLSYHPGIKVILELDQALLNIEGSEIHLRKTIMNLVSNAAEAQPSGGQIQISTSNQSIDSPIPGYESIRKGEYICMRVEDKGVGIEPEDLEKIFEPFFTKKKMGRSGTGLGMAVVWGTVQDHNGYIIVESKKEEGTVFFLYFPATLQPPSKKDSVSSGSDLKGAGQTILVVDDIKEQRLVACHILKRLNYNVTEVESGEMALEFMRGNCCDLVLLDMIMEPGIDGLETYKRVQEICPDTKVIIVSGYSESDKVRQALELGAKKYIKKPYTVNDIGLAIKEAL